MRTDSVSRRGFLRGGLGAAALAGAAGSAATAAAQETTTIDMTDGLVFDPDAVTVAPGTTVVWENVGAIGHSVTAYEDGIPEEADYFASGGFDGEQAARDAYPDGDIGGGGTYEHTFDLEGTYEYFCIPHESAGMLGTITVQEGGASTPESGGGGGAPIPQVPESALSVGLAALLAALTVVALAFFLLKYGGDYEAGEE